MLIKKAIHQNCKTCGRFEKELSPEQHGCDQCGKPIVPYGNDERLDVTVFYSGRETLHNYFCSWKCVFKFVKKVKSDHFFTLPFVSFDNKIPGRRAEDFQKEIKNL